MALPLPPEGLQAQGTMTRVVSLCIPQRSSSSSSSSSSSGGGGGGTATLTSLVEIFISPIHNTWAVGVRVRKGEWAHKTIGKMQHKVKFTISNVLSGSSFIDFPRRPPLPAPVVLSATDPPAPPAPPSLTHITFVHARYAIALHFQSPNLHYQQLPTT